MTRSRRRADQGGFTLLAVLMAVGFFSLILVALLEMVVTDTRTNTSFANSARARRSADGALQVGLTRLKTATPAQIEAGGSCAGVDGSQTTVEGRVATVRCEIVPSTDLPIASPGSGGTVLTLLGNYNGTLDDGVYNEVGGVLQPVVATIADWLNAVVANGPGLIHAGREPVRIAGDVKVRQWTLGITDPPSYPAIDVVGKYEQGDPGFLNTGANPCGILTQNLDPAESGLRLRATVAPTCRSGSAADRNTVAAAAGPSVTPATTWTPAAVAAAARTAGTCTAGTVKAFEPGSYSATQTAIMNTWFLTGNCDNVTFWFKPGDYYFETAGIWDNDPRALVLNDNTSNWVFGVPRGWGGTDRAASDDFPEACDRTAAGVSITLSSSTSVKHKAGQVAICGPSPGGTAPAIYQPVTADNQTWAGEPGTATTPPASAAMIPFSSTSAATATVAGAPATYPALGKNWDGSEGSRLSATAGGCTAACAIGIVVGDFADPVERAPSGNLSRAVLNLKGTAVAPPNDPNVQTAAIVTFNDGSGQACTVRRREIPRAASAAAPTVPGTFTVDLLQPNNPFDASNPTLANSCIGILNSATQLENASVQVYIGVAPQQWCEYWWSCVQIPGSATLDYVWMETTTSSVVPPSPFGTVVDPAARTSMNVFGPVVLPRSQVEVKWAGSVNQEPIFVGSLVARGLASTPVTPSARVGVLVSKTLVQPKRRIRLTAEIDGRIRGTAEIVIDDTDTSGTLSQPGRTLEVAAWKLA